MTVSPAVLDQVWARDDSRCFVCTRRFVRGQGGYSVHHRRPRGTGGSSDPVTDSPANLILLCGTGTTGCHGWIEHNRADARQAGLLVSRYADPREVPVTRWRTRSVLLTVDGSMIDGERRR